MDKWQEMTPRSQISLVEVESTARRQALKVRIEAIGEVPGAMPTRRESMLQRIALDVLEASRQWALRSVIKPEDWAIVFRASRSISPELAIKAWDSFKAGLRYANVPHSRHSYPVTGPRTAKTRGACTVTARVGIAFDKKSVEHARRLISHERLAPKVLAALRSLKTLLTDVDVMEATISRRETEGASLPELRAARAMLAHMCALARMKQGRLLRPTQRLARLKKELWSDHNNLARRYSMTEERQSLRTRRRMATPPAWKTAWDWTGDRCNS